MPQAVERRLVSTAIVLVTAGVAALVLWGSGAWIIPIGMAVGSTSLILGAGRSLLRRRARQDVANLCAATLAAIGTTIEFTPGLASASPMRTTTAGVALFAALAIISVGVVWEVTPAMPATSRNRAFLDSILSVTLITATFWNALLVFDAQPGPLILQAAVSGLLFLLLCPTAFAATGFVNDPTDQRVRRLVIGFAAGVLAGLVWVVDRASGAVPELAKAPAIAAALMLAVALGTASTGTRTPINLAERFARRARAVGAVFVMYIASLATAMFMSGDHLVMGTLNLFVLSLAIALQSASGRENTRLHEQLIVQMEDLGRSEERFRALAWTDELTGLLNRRSFVEQLDRRLRQGRPFAVLFMDLDRFKEINDTLGHEAGDEMLVEIGNRISRALGPSVDIARFGGDEFCVLVPEIAGTRHAVRCGERILDALREPVEVARIATFVTASIGVALSDKVSTSAQLLSDADAAMYAAKRSGRLGIAVFDEKLRDRATERLRIANELPRAIRNELVVHYQPVVALADGSVTGFEALVRWQHPVRGLVPPNDFIDIAEDTGLIVPLGAHVLETACRQLGTWISDGRVSTRTTVSVNLSPRQISDAALSATIADALVTARLDAANLILEITESALMSEGGDIDAVVKELRNSGVRFSVDDFGTGYSSLTYLKRFPVDALKIDRAFVNGMPDDADDVVIVDAVVGLANALGLDCVAEGVEVDQQMDYLKSIGCSHAQGYLIAKPMSAEDTVAWLNENALGVSRSPIG